MDQLGTAEGQPVVFSATFATASATSYEPGACDVLSATTTVQQALDELCSNLGEDKDPETLQITSIRLLGPEEVVDLVEKELIMNGLEVRSDAFLRGIAIGVSGPPIQAKPLEYDPIVEVELDLPYPTTDFERRYWIAAGRWPDGSPGVAGPFGFHRTRLNGEVHVLPKPKGQMEAGLVWLPTEWATVFLETIPQHRCGYASVVLEDELKELGWQGEPEEPRVMCRLRVRSAHVWTDIDEHQRAYLNAEHLGTSDGATGRELLVTERDPQRAGDLDMFFYLTLTMG
jgi:hypothetical protein